MRVQALSAQVAALAASKTAVPTGVPVARRPSGAWCMPSQVATDTAAAVLRVNCELVGLNTETEGGGEGCQDLEGPHGGLSGCIYMLVVPGISRSIEHAPSFQVFATECVEQSYGLRYLSSKDFSCCMIALCEQSLRFSIWHRVLCVTECIRVE
jgi:hypothetical protein